MRRTVTAGDAKRHVFGVTAALALSSLSMTALAQQPEIPVLAGGEADFDACGSQGVVRGLDPSGDGFLAVRSGPSSKHAVLDRVYNGAILNLCDQRGRWLGVVYSHETMDCGVGTPWPRRDAYSGPCRSGWVFRKYVADYAG
ncbi:SH3 domain-containing protein [Methyloceanibacter methanicus]|nr:SH3 domain-containing protein [Methyloceanibacter methanicus]